MFCGHAFSVTQSFVDEETSCGFPTRPRRATPVPFKYSIVEPVPAPEDPVSARFNRLAGKRPRNS